MISNYEILQYCLNNPDTIIDKYCEGLLEKIIIPKSATETNTLLEANKKMIELFTTLQTLNNMNDYSKDDKIVEEINEIIKKTEHINYSPFIQYLMIHNLNFDIYKNELSFEEQKAFIKEYIKDRHTMYLSHGYSNITYQILSDNYSHKRKGDLGTKKLRIQTEKLGIQHYNKNNQTNYYISPDKGDEKLFFNIIKINKIDYSYYKEKNGKLPDLFIRIKDKYIFIEHKNIKQGGGHQNNVLVEVKDFINETVDKRIYFVSYLDGIYFKEIFESFKFEGEILKGINKTERTINNISEIFKKSKNSYFVNTKGFEKFIEEILKE